MSVQTEQSPSSSCPTRGLAGTGDAGAGGGEGGEEDATLPYTGVDTAPMAGLGTLARVAGALLLLALLRSRRQI